LRLRRECRDTSDIPSIFLRTRHGKETAAAERSLRTRNTGVIQNLMEAGINFFPDVTPQERPADIYFDECLRMVAQADELGFHHVRIVEHYFHRYGGYSPNPIVFLSAAAQRSRRLKL